MLDATEAAERFSAGVSGGHATAQVPFGSHLQVRAQLFVHVVFETTAMEDRSETVEEKAAIFAQS